MNALVLWHLSLPLMNSFNITEAAIFPIKASLPEGFLFSRFNLILNTNVNRHGLAHSVEHQSPALRVKSSSPTGSIGLQIRYYELGVRAPPGVSDS